MKLLPRTFPADLSRQYQGLTVLKTILATLMSLPDLADVHFIALGESPAEENRLGPSQRILAAAEYNPLRMNGSCLSTISLDASIATDTLRGSLPASSSREL